MPFHLSSRKTSSLEKILADFISLPAAPPCVKGQIIAEQHFATRDLWLRWAFMINSDGSVAKFGRKRLIEIRLRIAHLHLPAPSMHVAADAGCLLTLCAQA
jgi:hypothetical protein